jgi:hypothetical protein
MPTAYLNMTSKGCGQGMLPACSQVTQEAIVERKQFGK